MSSRIRVAALGDRLELAGETAHYLARVLRLGPGDALCAFDGVGGEQPMLVERIERDLVILAASGPAVQKAGSSLRIRLLQAMAKGDKMPRIVRACTELGVSCIAPVVSERAVSRPDEVRGQDKADRLARVASEAARQCGRADVPDVLAPRSLAQALDELEGDSSPWRLRIALWEGESQVSLGALLPAESPDGIALLVGPEGGWSEAEMARARASGFRTASLGNRILRTETVAPALLAVLQFRYGDLGN